MWHVSDSEWRGCLVVFVLLCIFAIVGLAASGYGVWWLWHNIDIIVRRTP